MNTITMTEEFFPGQWEYHGEHVTAAAWEAPSGNGFTCLINHKHYPYDSVAVRELPDIHAAEIAVAAFIKSLENRKEG